MPNRFILSTIFIFLSLSFDAKAQDEFENWDKNYEQIDFLKILAFEKSYADSIDATASKSEYYTRIAKYRFSATYLGEKRNIEPRVMRSMKNVFKLFGGETSQIESMVEREYLFRVGDKQFWAPIQKQLEKPLKKEVKKGESAMLYCLFLNEHSSNGLFNSFLISEFKKD